MKSNVIFIVIIFIIFLFCDLKPMSSEQLYSDRDSEDEIDDNVADLEERKVH